MLMAIGVCIIDSRCLPILLEHQINSVVSRPCNRYCNARFPDLTHVISFIVFCFSLSVQKSNY